MAKILISPGFGAGWSTWMHEGGHEGQVFALSYKPLIEALESGDINDISKAVSKFTTEFERKFGSEPYTGGLRDLIVMEVTKSFRVEEYDGRESLIFREDDDSWFVPVNDEIV
jgi:hypothetical protein